MKSMNAFLFICSIVSCVMLIAGWLMVWLKERKGLKSKPGYIVLTIGNFLMVGIFIALLTK